MKLALSRNQSTFLGVLAPIFFGANVALIRMTTSALGLTAGAAFLFGFATLFAALFFGLPRLSSIPKKYLLWGVGSALLCEICYFSSLALSRGGQQTIEVGMVNYLWPCFTILGAVLFCGQKARWWLVIGLLISLFGICQVLSGDQGFSLATLWAHMQENPLSFGLALADAFLWAAYNLTTHQMSEGHNPIVLIFALCTLVFTGAYLLGWGPRVVWAFSTIEVAFIAALVMACAFALWTLGSMRGNLTLLSIASYFTPVLSCLIASVLLHATLTAGFYEGVLLVCVGSILCWLATRAPQAPHSRHH